MNAHFKTGWVLQLSFFFSVNISQPTNKKKRVTHDTHDIKSRLLSVWLLASLVLPWPYSSVTGMSLPLLLLYIAYIVLALEAKMGGKRGNWVRISVRMLDSHSSKLERSSSWGPQLDFPPECIPPSLLLWLSPLGPFGPDVLPFALLL